MDSSVVSVGGGRAGRWVEVEEGRKGVNGDGKNTRKMFKKRKQEAQRD